MMRKFSNRFRHASHPAYQPLFAIHNKHRQYESVRVTSSCRNEIVRASVFATKIRFNVQLLFILFISFVWIAQPAVATVADAAASALRLQWLWTIWASVGTHMFTVYCLTWHQIINMNCAHKSWLTPTRKKLRKEQSHVTRFNVARKEWKSHCHWLVLLLFSQHFDFMKFRCLRSQRTPGFRR